MSTFTAAKSLELVARGADVGVWDTPENANWSVVDACLGGITTISLNNSNVVLTGTQAESAMITFNSTLTGSVAITFPSTITGFYTIQNLCTGSSGFTITLQTTVAGGQSIMCMPINPFDIINDGSNIKFKNLERVGTYWDYAGSSVPAWIIGCTIPPYLNCDGSTFASSVYPALASILGSTTLPDSKGRFRAALNQGSGRLSSAAGLAGDTLYAGGGNQTTTLAASMIPLLSSANGGVTDPGHTHTINNQGGGVWTVGGAVPLLGGASPMTPATLVNTTNTANITVGSNTPAGTPVIPPAYIGGLQLIRAG